MACDDSAPETVLALFSPRTGQPTLNNPHSDDARISIAGELPMIEIVRALATGGFALVNDGFGGMRIVRAQS